MICNMYHHHHLFFFFELQSAVCAFLVCLYPTERTRLKDGEYPLVARVLCGPCEKISKIFIMEADLGEEVTHDVSLGSLPPLTLLSHLVHSL